MCYTDIENGTYKEVVKCRVDEIQRSDIQKTKKEDSSVLRVNRVPSVLHATAFAQTDKGYYVHTELVPDKNKIYTLYKEDSKRGTEAELVLTYKYYTHNELLARAGIQENERQSSYNKVGHIVHINLNKEAIKHKKIMAHVLLNKIKDCKTVIRKAENITGVYRNISIEHLAGERRYKTLHKENGMQYSIDYEHVYWNSKLQTERWKLAQTITEGDSVCDMFCGVGPFSILMLARGATVYANDMNPASVQCYKDSIVINRKVLGIDTHREDTQWNSGIEDRVKLYNTDAAHFLHTITYDSNDTIGQCIVLYDHYILNLPELTLHYLTHFVFCSHLRHHLCLVLLALLCVHVMVE